MKKFFKADRGSVSVFAILLILPIFLMNALFIDTLRIISAERQVENAMDSALRSTMAQFNEKLANVGLFGYAGDQAEASDDFEKYVEAQFYTGDDLSGTQNLVSPSIDSATASFDSSRNLVDLDIMEHQVLESMKYQAPAQIGKELYNLVTSGVRDVSNEDAEGVEDLSETYEEIFELVKKRNAKIDAAIEDINKYITMMETELGTIVGPAASGEEIPATIKGMNGLVHFHDRYKELIEQEETDEDEDEEIENYEDQIDELRSKHKQFFNKFRRSKSNIFGPLFGSYGSPDDYFPLTAKDYNEQIQELLDSINFDDYDLDPQESEEVDKLKKIALEDEFFEQIFSNIEYLYAQFEPGQTMSQDQAINSSSYSSFTVVQVIDGFYKVIEEHKTPATQIKNDLKNREENYKDTHLKYLKEQLADYTDSNALIDDEEFQRQEEESDTSFNELWDLITGAGNLADDQGTYDELSSIIAEYDAISGDGDEEDPDKGQFIKDAFERFTQFAEFVQGFPDSFRDELYINEYIMANYGTSEPYELTDPNSYLYENKQAEFITYGSDIAGVNYLLFIKDIAMVLFVINLLEKVLMEGGFAGPIGFLRALVRAFTETVVQITDLTTSARGGYKLDWRPFKVTKIEMTMPLFLRLFMMMKSTGEDYNNDKLRRLQASITLDTDVHLDNSPSYIEGHVEGKVKLWFIPALTEFLPGDLGNVSGNVYNIDKKKVYSY
ncbi:hypothetical protein CIL05_13395 [Virgibacillus profundi]|uniref:Uncharacterized protein n=1 Tax=Virgibacillus profundi TaxID=2024555 RepID=A0A2A2ICW7_9BACI|nr:Tad domain-containing protein [Virgibacillus profundi]PAV28970.1 hypothetical protein CIL05_13395 [Virgibacillus profundi]PXY53138.1 hypothetical protein CIT14_13520 [Virgibacillus profundi]